MVCDDNLLGKATSPYDGSAADDTKIAISIRQDALYSQNNDGTPYDYATLPHLIGTFLGLLSFEDGSQFASEFVQSSVEFEYVCNIGDLSSVECPTEGQSCGEEGAGTCVRRCYMTGDGICDTPSAPVHGYLDDLERDYSPGSQIPGANMNADYCLFTTSSGCVSDDFGQCGDWDLTLSGCDHPENLPPFNLRMNFLG